MKELSLSETMQDLEPIKKQLREELIGLKEEKDDERFSQSKLRRRYIEARLEGIELAEKMFYSWGKHQKKVTITECCGRDVCQEVRLAKQEIIKDIMKHGSWSYVELLAKRHGVDV